MSASVRRMTMYDWLPPEDDLIAALAMMRDESELPAREIAKRDQAGALVRDCAERLGGLEAILSTLPDGMSAIEKYVCIRLLAQRYTGHKFVECSVLKMQHELAIRSLANTSENREIVLAAIAAE